MRDCIPTGPRTLPATRYIRADAPQGFSHGGPPGQAAEYERRHRPIWPEFEAMLVEHGVRTLQIFLDARTRISSATSRSRTRRDGRRSPQTDVCRRWWRHMREIMPANPDDSPVSRGLREVFHIRSRARLIDARDAMTHDESTSGIPRSDCRRYRARRRGRRDPHEGSRQGPGRRRRHRRRRRSRDRSDDDRAGRGRI